MNSRPSLRLARLVLAFSLGGAVGPLLGCGASEGGGAPTTDAGSDQARPGTGGSSSSSGGSGPAGTGGATATGGTTVPGSGGAAQSGGVGGVVGTGGSAGQGGGAGDGAGGAASGGAPQGTGGRAGAGGGSAGTGGRASGGNTGSGGAAGAGGNITIWLSGDSTVATGTSPCPYGWGGQFKAHFNSSVTVKNNALAGRSLRTWLYNVLSTEDATGECNLVKDASGNPVIQPAWQAMLDASTGMKPGDYLFIQFGINDGGSGTASPNGCPRYEGDAAFKTSLGMMAQAAKARGARPVFVTPVSSIACTGSVARGTRGRFVTDTIAAGVQYDVPVVDLHMLSVALYNARAFCPLPNGATDVSATTGGAVGAFFCDDHTHFSLAGSVDIGDLMVDGIRGLNLPLASYLN